MAPPFTCVTVRDLIKLGTLPKTLILAELWKRLQKYEDETDDESAPDEPDAEPQGD